MQLELNSAFASLHPLATPSTAAWFLNLRAYDIKQACDEGTLAWTFDVGNGHLRTERRIWRGCLLRWWNSSGKDGGATASAAEVLADIVPPYDPNSAEVARRLSISRTALQGLLSAGLLNVKTHATKKQGVNAACRIDRDSLLNFLRKRRLS